MTKTMVSCSPPSTTGTSTCTTGCSSAPLAICRGPAQLLWIRGDSHGKLRKVGDDSTGAISLPLPVFLSIKERKNVANARCPPGSTHCLQIKADITTPARFEPIELHNLIGVKFWHKRKQASRQCVGSVQADLPSFKLTLHDRQGGYNPSCELAFSSYRQCQKWRTSLTACIIPSEQRPPVPAQSTSDWTLTTDSRQVGGCMPWAGCRPYALPRPLITIKQFFGYYVEPDSDPYQQQKLRYDKRQMVMRSRQKGYVEILEMGDDGVLIKEAESTTEDVVVAGASSPPSKQTRPSLLSKVRRRLHLNARLKAFTQSQRVVQNQSQDQQQHRQQHENAASLGSRTDKVGTSADDDLVLSRQDSGILEDSRSHNSGEKEVVEDYADHGEDEDNSQPKTSNDLECKSRTGTNGANQPNDGTKLPRKQDIASLFANMKRIDMDEVYGNTARCGHVV